MSDTERHQQSGARRLVLASQSPRRQALLEQLGLAFEVVAEGPNDPPLAPGLPPAEACAAAAVAKARAVSRGRPGHLVLGADTIVCLAERIFGKPEDEADAARMLQELSGRSHTVRTGVALVCHDDAGSRPERDGLLAVRSVATTVRFRKLTDAQIARYVATGEPLDKAGAYGIQGRGAALVEAIEGDYFNVVGLPLATVCEMLALVGIEVP
jgi:septum formation protein